MFNTADTNYLEVGDFSEVINAEQDATTKNNNAEYAARGAEAVRMAEQRSRNFQKFGQLIKQGGQFAKELDQWNQANNLLKSQKATDVLDKEITGGKDKPNVKPTVPLDQLPKGSTKRIDELPKGETTTIDKVDEQEAQNELAAKSNEASKEAKIITGELETEISNTDSTAAKEEYIAVSEGEMINDYNTRGAALTNDLKTDHAGYVTNNLTRKVKLEGMSERDLAAGGISVQEAINRGDLAMVAQLQKFWDQSWYAKSGIFKGGDNYLGRNQRLELLKQTNETTAAMYRKAVDSHYLKTKKAAEVTRQTDFAKDVNVNGIEALVGDGKDPNSGYIAQYEYATGVKNTAYAYQLLGDDLEKQITNGSIPPEKAEKMLNGEFKQRGTDGQITTLEKAQPEFYNRISKVIEKTKSLNYLNSQNEQKLDIQTKVTAQLDHIKNNMGGEISEVQLRGLVEEVTNDLNITEAHPHYKELEPLLQYRTSEDKEDQDIIKMLERDFYDPENGGHIDNLEMRLNEINDPVLRAAYRKKYTPSQILEVHKEDYKADLKIVEDFIDQTLKRESNVKFRDAENNQIVYNAKLDFKATVEDLIGKGVAPSVAFKKAREKVIATFNEKDDKEGLGKGYKYLDATLAVPEVKNRTTILKSGQKAADMINNAEVQEDLLHSKEMLPGESNHKEATINYLSGNGPMPLYYLQVGVGAKNYTSHEVIQMRAEALGYTKEGKVVIPESKLDPSTKTLFCHMPGDGKAMRGLINISNGQNIWSEDYKDTTGDILKSLEKNPLPESFVSPTGGKRINPTVTTLGEVNDLMKTKGYGLYGGVGLYGHTTGDLNKAVEILGEDILSMPFDKSTQQMVESALFMYNIMGKKMFTSISAYADSDLIKPLNISFTESAELTSGFGDDFYTGYNAAWCLDSSLTETILNEDE